FAVRTYGYDIASRFLLSYSEKLWGAPCEQLSPRICGSRLNGLGLKSIVIEALRGSRAKTEHLDGAFYYPRHGYGTIVERLADACGRDKIRQASRVTRIFHREGYIEAIEINGTERTAVDHVVCTLPLGLTLGLIFPSPPAAVAEPARKLRYRNVILVAV